MLSPPPITSNAEKQHVPNKTEMKKTRKIVFISLQPTRVDRVLGIHDYTAEEFRNCWYSKEEEQQMRQHDLEFSLQNVSGSNVSYVRKDQEPSHDADCLLLHQCRAAVQAMVREEARIAVLVEQGRYSPKDLAKTYRRKTERSKESARAIALEDEAWVRSWEATRSCAPRRVSEIADEEEEAKSSDSYATTSNTASTTSSRSSTTPSISCGASKKKCKPHCKNVTKFGGRSKLEPVSLLLKKLYKSKKWNRRQRDDTEDYRAVDATFRGVSSTSSSPSHTSTTTILRAYE